MAELDHLGKEIRHASKEIQELRKQQNSCNDAEREIQLEEQIEQLQQKYIRLIGQYTQEHALDTFTDAGRGALCALATIGAGALPTP